MRDRERKLSDFQSDKNKWISKTMNGEIKQKVCTNITCTKWESLFSMWKKKMFIENLFIVKFTK